MPTRRLEREFARRREPFAGPFYARHRSHVTGRPGGCGVAWLAFSGSVVVVSVLALVAGWVGVTAGGWGDGVRAVAAVGIFLLLAAGIRAGVRDQFAVRVLPYFERPVGWTDTFLAGEALVWHSRAVDEAAARCGVAPLSAFASGDDLIPGERVCWFAAADGLRTVERLLAADVAESHPPEVVADLERLRQALGRASDQGIRFGLLVREGLFASGHEMSVQQGSFF